MDKIETTLTHLKDTPGSHRYKEDPTQPGGEKIGGLYLKKHLTGGIAPKRIKVTIEVLS